VQVDESTGQVIHSVIEEALDKSLLPYLRQVQEVSAQVDALYAENQELNAELEKARRPWWKLW
jgi:regulator of replication initiation timing